MEHVILMLGTDLSRESGASINERESALALLERYPEHISVIAPKPEFPEVFSDPRLHYVRNHRSHTHNPISYLLYLWSAWRMIRRLLKTKGASGVAFRIDVTPVLPILTAGTGVPVLLKTLSGYAMYERRDRRVAFRFLSRLLRPFFNAALRSSAAADTPSHALAYWLEHRFGYERTRLRVIPNGVNAERFSRKAWDQVSVRLGIDGFRYRIGYVGALDNVRNVDAALEAMALLPPTLSVGLVIVGRGTDLSRLQQRAVRLGLSENVVFTGFQPYADIPAIISSFDVAFDFTVVEVRVEGHTELGSYSQKIPQYLACGVPVVVPRCRDTEFVERCGVGLSVDIHQTEEVRDAFLELLKRRGRGGIDGEIVRRAALPYAYRTLADRRFGYWQEVLSRTPKTGP